MLSSFLKLTAPPKNGFRQKYIEEKKLILELETHIAGIQQFKKPILSLKNLFICIGIFCYMCVYTPLICLMF